MFAVSDVRGECLHERLYEMGDVTAKLIGRAITCWYYWLEWYVGLMDFEKAIEEWSMCRIW